jgi:hypothetical protein
VIRRRCCGIAFPDPQCRKQGRLLAGDAALRGLLAAMNAFDVRLAELLAQIPARILDSILGVSRAHRVALRRRPG